MEEIKFEDENIFIDLHMTRKLDVNYFPANTTDDKSITWVSSDESVASVSESGIVKAVSQGEATITATSVMGPTATIKVNILVPIRALEFSQSSVTMEKGDILEMILTVVPVNTTDTVCWSSSDENIVTVDQTGRIMAKGVGSAVITVRTSRGVEASCQVFVTIPATGIVFDQKNYELFVDDSLELKPTLFPDDSTDEITWSSSDDSVIKVGEDGALLVVAAGTADITATAASGVSDNCSVTVDNDINKTSIVLAKDSYGYTGNAVCPDVEVKYGTKTLTINKDYKVEYADNTKIGKAAIKIIGVGRYSGMKQLTFHIIENELTEDNVSINLDDELYTGNEITKQVLVSINGQELSITSDYEVNYANNVSAGTATVTIEGKGNYSGTIQKTFEIIPVSIDQTDIVIAQNPTYTGVLAVPEVSVTWDGTILVNEKPNPPAMLGRIE